MIHYQQWLSQDPNERDHQRRQNEVRASVAYDVAKRFVHGVAGSVKALFAAYHRSQLIRGRQAAMRELGRLDDRLLKDLGIARGDIHAIVHNGRRPITKALSPSRRAQVLSVDAVLDTRASGPVLHETDCEIVPMPSPAIETQPAQPAAPAQRAGRDKAAA